MVGQDSPTLAPLDEQIACYDKRSQAAQRRYKALQLTQIIAAALIPSILAFPVPHPLSVTAAFGSGSPPEPIGNLPRQTWIVKAGEVLPQALIANHERRALKADASGIEVSPSTVAETAPRFADRADLDCWANPLTGHKQDTKTFH